MGSDGSAIRVLLVEDSPGDARLIRELLNQADAMHFSVTHVERLSDALAQLEPCQVDVVLADLSLPDSHGLDTVERLHAAAPDVPLVVLTGLDDETLGFAAVQRGAQDYLVKGQVTDPLLARAIRYGIERNHLEQGLRQANELLEARVQERTHDLEQAVRSLRRQMLELECAEAALKDSEERFRATFEQAAVGIAHVATHGSWLRVNDRLCEITGYTRAEMLQLRYQDLTHADDIEASQDHMQHCLNNATPSTSLEKRYLRKDGSTVWVNLTISLVREPYGAPIYFIVVAEDITQRKSAEAEIQRLYAELEQRVEKRTAELRAANDELESFSYSISHDLRAPLRAIGGFANIIVEDYGAQLPPEGVRHLGLVTESTRQMGRLIDDLLEFSRFGRKPVRKSQVDLADCVHSCVTAIRQDNPDRRVEVGVGELPRCHADPGLLRQVLLNLLSNAFKYTRTREQARIQIASEFREREVVVSVRDNGVGFDPRHANRLFGVFQRLHSADEFEGTGVGLSIVQRIVARHGGRVWAEAEPDKGACFYFSLPVKGDDGEEG